ncbi:MAG: hypothetical protein U0L20_06220 [Ruminococcus sp.]|nr:hypothetical protein [Ruminococcus sp.]
MKHIFRKGIALLLTLSIAVSMCLISASAEESTENMIFLKPSSNWYQDKARFAAYFFGGGSDKIWVSMDLVEDGVYSAPIPSDTHTKVIFCRMTYKSQENNWNNKWNQTSDLIIPTDGKNCYTIAEGSWDYGSGS